MPESDSACRRAMLSSSSGPPRTTANREHPLCLHLNAAVSTSMEQRAPASGFLLRVTLLLFLFPFIRSNPIPDSSLSPNPSMMSSSPISEAEGDMTPLQKHVSFFDRNNDGLIYPSETYKGFRAIGCSVAFSATSAVLINGFLGPKTSPPGKLPSAILPIYVKNIHKGIHGSDSGVYDAEGRFVASKFGEIFQKHAHTNPNALTSDELMEMLKANKMPNDSEGSSAALTEWKLLFSLCKDKDGFLHKDTIKAVYDGSLFYQLEKKARISSKKRG